MIVIDLRLIAIDWQENTNMATERDIIINSEM